MIEWYIGDNSITLPNKQLYSIAKLLFASGVGMVLVINLLLLLLVIIALAYFVVSQHNNDDI
ncbi:hypothetical protein C9I99_01840 [Photobacterium lutimaris]|uniref:Uncharacterized protein n=1 Tax=Photobacterium lutimaris TaxID=388278 RepID=A0A2T3J3B9_9GAMM|nr:hypothetical protein C9I99_01840 [Photobacterium lutimaris]